VTELATAYRAYLACLNARDWDRLAQFVAPDVSRNGERLGVAGYRAMLERDVDEIPDLVFRLDFLVTEPPWVAARLQFDCRPRARFLGLAVDGRRVAFSENVFYRYEAGRIAEVLSIVDKAAIEAQL
jgi:predicted ester cyclase